MDVQILANRQPDRNIFIRSDQYNFIRAGVPAIMPAFGSRTGSIEESLQAEWLKNRYHAPSDDARQAVDTDAAAKFDRLMVNLVTRIANAEERPHWSEKSYFRKFSKQTD